MAETGDRTLPDRRVTEAAQLRESVQDLVAQDALLPWLDSLAEYAGSIGHSRAVRCVKQGARSRRGRPAAAIAAAAVIAAAAGFQLTRPAARPLPAAAHGQPGRAITTEDRLSRMVALSACRALRGSRLPTGFTIAQARPDTGGPLAIQPGMIVTGLPALCAVTLSAAGRQPGEQALALLPLPPAWNGYVTVTAAAPGLSPAAITAALQNGYAVAETPIQADPRQFAAAAKETATAFYGTPAPLLTDATDAPAARRV